MGGADPDPRPVREVTPLMAAAGLMAFALILIFGVLIGKQGNGGGTQAAGRGEIDALYVGNMTGGSLTTLSGTSPKLVPSTRM